MRTASSVAIKSFLLRKTPEKLINLLDTTKQMGFLTVNGQLMTYDEYKHLINLYRAHGLLQFMKLWNVHKDRQIEPEDLHWGEEIEYKLYKFDEAN